MGRLSRVRRGYGYDYDLLYTPSILLLPVPLLRATGNSIGTGRCRCATSAAVIFAAGRQTSIIAVL